MPVAGLPVKATVTLLNTSTVAQQRLVELLIDGVKEASSPELNLPPQGRAKHEFVFTLQARRAAPRRSPPGRRGRLEIRRPPLLHHGGRPGHSRGGGQGRSGTRFPISTTRYYLEQALAAGRGGELGRCRPRRWLADDLAGEPLEKYKVLFCVNLPALDADAAERLAALCGRRRQRGLDLRRQRRAGSLQPDERAGRRPTAAGAAGRRPRARPQEPTATAGTSASSTRSTRP